jgi:hypothetical protein
MSAYCWSRLANTGPTIHERSLRKSLNAEKERHVWQHTDWGLVEGTISEAVVAREMRTSRYRGIQKTHLQHITTAAASNIKRLVNWWNDVPFSTTKRPRFSLLMTA